MQFVWSTPSCRQPRETYAAWLDRLKTEGPKPKKRSDIARDLQWWYQAEIRRPKVAKRKLASDSGVVRSGVQAGINRAKAVLSSITLK
jgi:hypothetical protein